MSNPIGVGSSKTQALINRFEQMSKEQTIAPKTGEESPMSPTAQKRMNELNSKPVQSLTKGEQRELDGLKRQYDRPDLMEKAKGLQEKGGVMAGHMVAMTKVADDKNVCICIRKVNTMSTSLIEAGYGTKDMGIKAKSSDLPPLCGFIPYDQALGKKGGDPREVEKFNHKNDEAIEKGVARKTDAVIPSSYLKQQESERGDRMRIVRDAPGLQPNEMLIIGNDFKSPHNPQGVDHHFIGVQNGENVTIFRAEQDSNGKWVKTGDGPVQLMANREGKAVTADYDLAVVAPKLSDIGPQHMSSLKMTSFVEVERRTAIVERHMHKIETLLNRFDNGKLGMVEHMKEFAQELNKLLPFDAVPPKDLAKILNVKDGGKAFYEPGVKREVEVPDDLKKLFAEFGKTEHKPSDYERLFQAARNIDGNPTIGQLLGGAYADQIELKIGKDDIRGLGKLAAQHEFHSTVVPQALKQNEQRYGASKEGIEEARRLIDSVIAPESGDTPTIEKFAEIFAADTGVNILGDRRFEDIVRRYPDLPSDDLNKLAEILGAAMEETAGRDIGITSSFVRDLVPELNETVGQTGGREVFHHGDDTGNPFSVEADNFPMTVILPKGVHDKGEQLLVIENATEFRELASDLKNKGYSLPINEIWNQDPGLISTRRSDFTEARNALARQLGGEVQEIFPVNIIRV